MVASAVIITKLFVGDFNSSRYSLPEVISDVASPYFDDVNQNFNHPATKIRFAHCATKISFLTKPHL